MWKFGTNAYSADMTTAENISYPLGLSDFDEDFAVLSDVRKMIGKHCLPFRDWMSGLVPNYIFHVLKGLLIQSISQIDEHGQSQKPKADDDNSHTALKFLATITFYKLIFVKL